MEKILPVLIIILILVFILFVISRYRKCPADKIMVVYGMAGKDKNGKRISAKCIINGGFLVWPIIQDYEYLDLKPITNEFKLSNLITKDNIDVNVDLNYIFSISTENGIMQIAVERFLGLTPKEINVVLEEYLIGFIRITIEGIDSNEIYSDKDRLIS